MQHASQTKKRETIAYAGEEEGEIVLLPSRLEDSVWYEAVEERKTKRVRWDVRDAKAEQDSK